jgi:hypothetical protein
VTPLRAATANMQTPRNGRAAPQVGNKWQKACALGGAPSRLENERGAVISAQHHALQGWTFGAGTNLREGATLSRVASRLELVPRNEVAGDVADSPAHPVLMTVRGDTVPGTRAERQQTAHFVATGTASATQMPQGLRRGLSSFPCWERTRGGDLGPAPCIAGLDVWGGNKPAGGGDPQLGCFPSGACPPERSRRRRR